MGQSCSDENDQRLKEECFLMSILVTMPRETDTSLFTSRLTQGFLLAVCCIGLILTVLVFIQNYKDWTDRRKKDYETEGEWEEAKKSANKDFVNSLLVILICNVFLIFLIFNMGMRLLQ